VSLTAERPRIGFIGLGVMGEPMAGRLVGAGYNVLVHNRSRPAVDRLAMMGAYPAQTVAEVASQTDVVITMLPDTADVEAVVLADEGVLASARRGTLVIDMSTIAPSTSQQIAAEASRLGSSALDAPVSGGQRGAIEGTLSIMCGGEQDVLDRARPILAHLGSRIVHVGGPGAGQVVKACNQIVVALTLEAMGEALVLGAKAGVEPASIVEALVGGAARCWALEVKAENVLRRDFAPGFRCALHHKDLTLALEAGSTLGVTLPVTALVRELFGVMKTTDRGDLDHSAIVNVIEDLSAFTVHAGPMPEHLTVVPAATIEADGNRGEANG
jgi:2-hydroxy-3-oxopropionate reductase